MELIDLEELDLDREVADPQRPVRPESLAYLLYTSGSTGQPKGVMHTHRTLLHMVMKYTNGIHISAQDRLSLLSSGSFAASVSDIYGALLNGATLFPFSVREHGVRELGRWLGQEAITLYASTPILFRSLAGTLKGQAAFPHLRLMKLGGELVTRKDVELYKSFAPPKCLLHVSLGSTEMSSIRQYNLDKDTPLAGDTVPVGYEQDSQVKMHGYRMELGEVEAALAQHPAVKATAVKVVERPKIKSWQRIW